MEIEARSMREGPLRVHPHCAIEKRIPYIDGLRAVSIMLVVLSHIPYANDTPVSGWLYSHGKLGVSIFFVISGFLITSILLTEIERTNSLNFSRFYLKRAFRLMPVYASYLLVVFFITLSGRHQEALSSWIGALTYTRNIIGRGDSFTVHFWSLAVEEQFYFTWPLALTAIFSTSLRSKLVLVFVLIVAATAIRFIDCGESKVCAVIAGPNSLFSHLDAILAGCAVAFIKRCRCYIPKHFVAGLSRASMLLLIVISTFVYDLVPWQILNLVQAVLIGSYILAIIEKSQPLEGFALEHPISMYLGKISYSLYVWHFIFLSHFGRPFEPYQLLVQQYWVLLSLATAILSYHFLELPCRTNLNRRFIHRERGKAA